MPNYFSNCQVVGGNGGYPTVPLDFTGTARELVSWCCQLAEPWAEPPEGGGALLSAGLIICAMSG